MFCNIRNICCYTSFSYCQKGFPEQYQFQITRSSMESSLVTNIFGALRSNLTRNMIYSYTPTMWGKLCFEQQYKICTIV
jgi:hypothetical protein